MVTAPAVRVRAILFVQVTVVGQPVPQLLSLMSRSRPCPDVASMTSYSVIARFASACLRHRFGPGMKPCAGAS